MQLVMVYDKLPPNKLFNFILYFPDICTCQKFNVVFITISRSVSNKNFELNYMESEFCYTKRKVTELIFMIIVA